MEKDDGDAPEFNNGLPRDRCMYCGESVFAGSKSFRVDATGTYHFDCKTIFGIRGR